MFGAKLLWEHHPDLVRRLGLMPEYAHLSSIERLWSPFGPNLRVTYLTRNCADSAVSLWRAEATNEWGRTPDAPPVAAPECLDVWRVSYFHAEMHAAAIAWPNLFRASRIEPLVVSYDDVVSDLPETVARIGAHVGVELPRHSAPTPHYVRQADDASRRFLEEWARATGGCAACGW